METNLERGGVGEFSVWVDGQKVAAKRLFFPSERKIVAAVRAALAAAPGRT